MDTRELRTYLETLQPGVISDTSRIEGLLTRAWDDSDDGGSGLKSWKIPGRLESVEWCPPRLCFTIERHGAIKCGSSRAELQDWVIDVQTGIVDFTSTRYRQLYRRSPPLKTKPIAEEIGGLIVRREDDHRLKWSEDKSRVRLVIREIVPDGIAKQTVAGRRKRFRRDLNDYLEGRGWQEIRANTYCLGPADRIGDGAERARS